VIAGQLSGTIGAANNHRSGKTPQYFHDLDMAATSDQNETSTALPKARSLPIHAKTGRELRPPAILPAIAASG
jgi:hypothetical protein